MTDSKDNGQGPERIWANPDHWINHPPRPDCFRPHEYVEYIRADLAPDPLADARVVALVEAVNETVRLLWEEMSKQGNVGTHGGYIYMKLRPALAAFDKGGKDE
jgi:hypothetical protein